MDESQANTTEVSSIPTERSRVTEAGPAVHRETHHGGHRDTAGSQEVAVKAGRAEKAESHCHCTGTDQNVEQRTILRQQNHVSPYFITIKFNVSKQILAISFICWVKAYLDFIGIK